MGIAHLVAIVDELVGNLTVIGELAPFGNAPRTNLKLINRHGRMQHVRLSAPRKPAIVMPVVTVEVPDLGSCCQAILGMERKRICFEPRLSVSTDDAVLVGRAILEARYDAGENAVAHFFHRVCGLVPFVEVAHNAYRLRVRCPNDETVEVFVRGNFARLELVTAEQTVCLACFTTTEQIQIGIGKLDEFFVESIHIRSIPLYGRFMPLRWTLVGETIQLSPNVMYTLRFKSRDTFGRLSRLEYGLTDESVQ